MKRITTTGSHYDLDGILSFHGLKGLWLRR